MHRVKGIEICVVGWYFSSNIYKQFKKSPFRFHIVAHRHNDILDNLDFKYSVIKNIGLEYGAYDWYIKNAWDKKSDILFIHDDIELRNFTKTFSNVFKKIRDNNISFSHILGIKDIKRNSNCNRCVFLSSKIVKLLLKKYGGIQYDLYNRGYVWGDKRYYDPFVYTNKYKEVLAQPANLFRKRVKAIVRDHNLKRQNIPCRQLLLCRRNNMLKDKVKRNISLIDNSVFGREENILETIALSKECETNRNRLNHFYTKWYNFYFKNIRKDNLSILEIGVKDSKSLNMWEKYFKNSDVYGSSCEIDSIRKVKSISLDGFDIIIDTGTSSNKNQINIFEELFIELNPGGIYVIENLQKSYSKKNAKRDISISGFLKKIVDYINFSGKYKYNNYEKLVEKSLSMERYERLVMGQSFHSGICFIFKRFCK